MARSSCHRCGAGVFPLESMGLEGETYCRRCFPAVVIERVCHISERTWEGTVYTLADERFPYLNGRRIIVRLVHGESVAEWVDEKKGER